MKRLICLLLLLALAFGAAQAEENVPFTSDYAAMNKAAESVLKVEITVKDGEEPRFATAFMAFDGQHAVMSARALTDAVSASAVTDSGAALPAFKVLAAEMDTDIAILAFDEDTGLAPLPFNESGEVLRASACAVIGMQGSSSSITLGNIGGTFTVEGITFVQFTAPVSAGAGGSPVFDMNGSVAGVTTGVYDDGTGVVQNLNFAMNVKHVKELYDLTKDDEPVDVMYWQGTDVSREAAYNAGQSEFKLVNDTGYSISAVRINSNLESRLSAWLKSGETVTIALTEEEVENGFRMSIETSKGGFAFFHDLKADSFSGKTYSVTLNNTGVPQLTVIEEGLVFPLRHEKPVRSTDNDTPMIPVKFDRPVDMTGKISLTNNSGDQVVTLIYIQRRGYDTSKAGGETVRAEQACYVYEGDTGYFVIPEKWLGDPAAYRWTVNVVCFSGRQCYGDEFVCTVDELMGRKYELVPGYRGPFAKYDISEILNIELPDGLPKSFTVQNDAGISISGMTVFTEAGGASQKALMRMTDWIPTGASREIAIYDEEFVYAMNEPWTISLTVAQSYNKAVTLKLTNLDIHDFLGKTLVVAADPATGGYTMYFE